MHLYDTIQYRGYEIKIYYDPDPESPRDWDNLGTMYTCHRNYLPEESFDQHFQFEEVFDQHQDFLPSFEKNYIAHKVYLYEHSGITVSTSPFSCRWDSGLFGIIAVSTEKVKQEYGWKKITAKRRTEIENILQAEVDIYDQYITGQVYGFQLFSPEGEEIDSCWGYFGDLGIKDIVSECKTYVDEEHLRKWKAKLKAGIQQFLPFPDLPLSTIQ